MRICMYVSSGKRDREGRNLREMMKSLKLNLGFHPEKYMERAKIEARGIRNSENRDFLPTMRFFLCKMNLYL